jgi:hypothetical protein
VNAPPPFRAGRVIGRSLQVWLRHLPLLFALVLVVNVPYIAWGEYRALVAADRPSPGIPSMLTIFARYGRGLLIDGIFTRLSQAVVIFAVYRRLRGEQPSFRGSLRGGLRRFWPVLRVTLALFAIEFSVNVALWFIYSRALEFVPYNPHLYRYSGYVMHALALLAMTPFWVAVPGAVVEGRRSLLGLSWTLTRGHRLRIYGIVLVTAALGYAKRYVGVLVLDTASRPVAHTFEWAQELLLISLGAVLAVVGYRALRLHKEGIDVAKLERIFD